MTVTVIDPRTALIVVDLQVGTTSAGLAHPVRDVVSRSVSLLEVFRARGLPVVLANVHATPAGRTVHAEGSRVFPPAFAELVPELDPQPGDIRVTRRGWSVFTGTGLHETLDGLGVTQVVIVGVATSFGVESTARSAYDLGYSVTVVEDAISDRSADAHAASVARVFPALGRLASAAEVLASLPPRD